MNIFKKTKLIKQLINCTIKAQDGLPTLDLNKFVQILDQLTESEILELSKNKKINSKLIIGYSTEYSILTDENKKALERIEKLLVQNNIKNIQICNTRTKEIWKEYMLKNPKDLVYYMGELDDELKETFRKIIRENPNLIYSYYIGNHEIITEAFLQDEITLKFPTYDEQSKSYFRNTILDHYNFLQIPQVYITAINRYKDNLDNPIIKPLLDELRKSYTNIDLINDVLKSLDDETIKIVFPEENYHFFCKNFDTLKVVKTDAFKKLCNIYGPAKLCYSEQDRAEILGELYNYNKDIVKEFLNPNYDIDKRILEFLDGTAASVIFRTAMGGYYPYETEILKFFQIINYKITKEDVLGCAKLYDYIDETFVFTLDDFSNNFYTGEYFTGYSNRILLECLDYLNPIFLKEVRGKISDEVVEKAIKKGYKFTAVDFINFNYNQKILNYLIENKDFDIIYSLSNITDEIFDRAFEYGFIPDLNEVLKRNKKFLDNDKVVKKMIETNQFKAIFYYQGDNVEVYEHALSINSAENNYSQKELEYLKLVIKSEGLAGLKKLKQISNNEQIDYYFDESGPNQNFYTDFWKGGYETWTIIAQTAENQYKNYLDEKQIKAIHNLNDIQFDDLKSLYAKFILENLDTIREDQIEIAKDLLIRISNSNSTEMIRIRASLARELLQHDNSMEKLDEIEQIFIKNNLPIVGKHYKVFKILNPNYTPFNIENSRTVSPTLKNISERHRDILIFADLIKASFGSNNRSVTKYLKNIKLSSEIFRQAQNGKKLTEKEIQELNTFRSHLITLYNNSTLAQNLKNQFEQSSNLLADITKLLHLISPNKTLDYQYEDRIINMFCHFAGLSTYDQATRYVEQAKISAIERAKRLAAGEFKLQRGDLIKGIGKIEYLSIILQNGSVAKEFLGSSSTSDATPLDTDCSMIMKDYETFNEALNSTQAASYGPIYFVLKNTDNRFNITRTESETKELTKSSQLELFYTGALGQGHYGIRTGFASTEIDYIVTNRPDSRIYLDIVKNGFYIPVVSNDGELLFSYEDYQKLRSKMQGLSEYDMEEYTISDNLINEQTALIEEQIEDGMQQTILKRKAIEAHIARVLNKFGLKLKTTIDGDLTEGFAELIDTGSTSRYTNKIGDGDFDYMLRVDNIIYNNPKKLEELKEALKKSFIDVQLRKPHNKGDIRYEGVTIEGLDCLVDLDISFARKTTGLSYSTDMCLNDRLENIKKQHPEKYTFVIANIILAKQTLKEAGVYKSSHAETPQGGLGGVGIENWILQYGGSFEDAAQDFLKQAEGKTFEEFIKSYEVWDFGENHKAALYGKYPHDNFVTNNMNEEGYNKMISVLKKYLYSKAAEQEKGSTLKI